MPNPYSAVYDVLQVGTETTPGTGGSADKKLATLRSEIDYRSNGFGTPRPSGGKYVGTVVPVDMWAEGAISDPAADFNAFPYLLSSNLGYAAPTVAGAVATWVHTSSAFAASTLKTQVWQRGQTGAVQTFRNVMIPDFNINFRRSSTTEVGGLALGKRPTLGTALTAATSIASVPMNGKNTSVYYHTAFQTPAGLGTRLSPKGYNVSFRHNGVIAPDFVLDDSVTSFDALLEGDIDCGGTLIMRFDVTGTDLSGPLTIAELDAATVNYLAVQNIGPLISGGDFYTFTLAMAIQLSAAPRVRREGNAMVVEFAFTCVPDPTTGKVVEITVKNTVTAI